MFKSFNPLLTILTSTIILFAFQTDLWSEETAGDSTSNKIATEKTKEGSTAGKSEIVTEKAKEDSSTDKNEVVIEKQKADSTRESFPQKLRARKPWEYIVSTPLWIATSPLWLLYKGTAAVIGFVDEHDIPEKVERVLISEDGTREILPAYSTRTGAGVSYSKVGLFNPESELFFAGSYWLQHRHSVEAAFTGLKPAKDHFLLDINFLYEYVPDEPFFGQGPDTKESPEYGYTYRAAGGQMKVGIHMFPKLYVSIGGGLGQYKISKCGKEEDDELETIDPIYHSKAVLGGIKAEVTLDTRDRKAHPTKGTLINMSTGFSDEVRRLGGHDVARSMLYGFSCFSADLKQYIHLPWGKGRVLALRTALDMKEEIQDKQIPFYLLSELGSDETIRGFQRGRYRDKDAVLASAEYRYPIWEDHPNSLDWLIFIDAGQVAPNIFSKFKKDNMRYGYGFGFRFYNDENDDLMAKLAFGFSKHEFRVIFGINE